MSDNRGVVYLVAAILAAEASLAAQPSEAEIRQILVDRIDVRHVSIGMVAGIDAGGGWVYAVTHEGNALRIQLPAAPKFRLLAETERGFFIKEADIQISFERDEKGRATGLILHLWGFNIPAKRLDPPK